LLPRAHMHGRERAACTVQRYWRRYICNRHAATSNYLVALSTCAVCQDECVDLVRCANGHGCCIGCEINLSDTRCPLCRDIRLPQRDTLFPSLLRVADVRFRCGTCRKVLTVAECEPHRAWCDAHRFQCPFPACTACVCAAEMVSHMQQKHNVTTLRMLADGTYHLIVGMLPGSEATVYCVDDVTVVVETSAVGRRQTLYESQLPELDLHIRAYYASPNTACLKATVRQLLPSQLDTYGEWLEEHRCGVVPPVLACRESKNAQETSVRLTPRSLLSESRLLNENALRLPSIANVRPGTAARSHVSGFGIRDTPCVVKPLTRRTTNDVPVALLHFVFRQDSSQSIAKVFVD